MPAQEEFSLANAYTLDVTRSEETILSNRQDYPVVSLSSITRSFNFAARQVITRTRDVVYQEGGYKYGGSGGVSTTLNIQSFEDVPAPDEIAAMHKKLTEMGGSPPPLDEVLNTLSKPAKPLSRGTTP
ncbi:MAG: hypothetical protein GC185_01380 [Alphaproteobacteria bacterium]|nr:hypothetical protein [Alphaproteobacteria bacterium]